MSDIEASISRQSTSRLPKLDGHIDLTDNTQPAGDIEQQQPPEEEEEDIDDTVGLTRTRTWRANKERVKQELARRKYAKYAGPDDTEPSRVGTIEEVDDEGLVTQDSQPGQLKKTPTVTQNPIRRGKQKVKGLLNRRRVKGDREGDYVVEVLYENQRGTWLFGVPYYSSASLLNFDHTAWTDPTGRPSPVDVTNAQLPDPSWQWTWPRWYVDMSLDVDEQGWQYSFMFQNRFTWHGVHPWFHSFVRRRRWIRKRVRTAAMTKAVLDDAAPDSRSKKAATNTSNLGSEYFSVRAMGNNNGGIASGSASANTSHVLGAPHEPHDAGEVLNVQDLLQRLKKTTLDREKIALVLRYVDGAGEDLHHLADETAHIMSMLMFQHSRRTLLARLVQKLDERLAGTEKRTQDAAKDKGKKTETATAEHDDRELEQRKTEYLQNVVGVLDGEIRKMEYWSDLVEIAKEGKGLGTAEAITEPPAPTKSD